MPDKKILLVSRPINSPWDEASKNFVRNLAQNVKKFQMTILTNRPLGEYPGKVTELPVYSKDYLTIWQRFRLIGLRKYRGSFDIVHYLFTPTMLNSMFLRFITSSKNTMSVQTVATIRTDRYKIGRLRKMLHADLIITYSNYSKRKLEALGISNVACIYPGIDLNRFKPQPKNMSLAKMLGISKKDFVVMYPGEYIRLGATDMLVDMLPELVAKIPSIKFVFACRIKNTADKLKKQETIERITDMGLSKHVVYTDTIRDMPSLYGLSDLTLFPVINMNGKFDVPLAVIEAMACQNPLIISDLPVLCEFASDENSVIVPTANSQALIEAIEKLYLQPKLRAKIANNGRMYVEKHFDITQITSKYEWIYHDVLNLKRPDD